MKTFFEEYGFVLVSIVVVALLVGMTSPIGAKVKTRIEDTIDGITIDWTAKDTDGNLSPIVSVEDAKE